VGLWDQIRDALRRVWADWQSPGVDARTQLVASLTEAWQAEQHVSRHIRLTIPEILYEHFRQRLEVMARDDDQHAQLLQEHLGSLGVIMADPLLMPEGSANSLPSNPWRRLQHILTEKRELYERYHHEASTVDEHSLHSLLERLRDDEEHHQEQLVEMLMQLDAHVHETIT
jgi:hypothetical protein